MGSTHLSGKPKIIKGNPNAWWYEEKKGIEILHEIVTRDGYIRTDHLVIPWNQIRAALQRKDKK